MVLYVARHAACEHRNMAISWLHMTIYSISGYILAINSTSKYLTVSLWLYLAINCLHTLYLAIF